MTETAKTKLCRMCRRPVTPGARICTNCGASQTTFGQIAMAMKWIGAAATIVSLLIGMTSLYGLYNAQLNTQAAVRELTNAADLLRDEGAYRRAWQLYDDAAALDASSLRVRRGREHLARVWLPRASVTGNQTFSALVDEILPVLLRGYQQSRGSRAADYLALSGWAHYLERRERPFSEVDIPGTYRKALAIHADNTYAHTFLGHWLISEEEDLATGTEHFRTAVASQQETPLVRYYQASALQNLLGVSSNNPGQISAVYTSFLVLLNNMLHANEDLATSFQSGDRTLYQTLNAYAMMTFEDVLPVLTAAEHRQLISRLAVPPQNLQSGAVMSSRLFLAQLLEHEGNEAEALSAFQSLGVEVRPGSQLRAAVDAGLERLSGQKTAIALEREDPVAFHTNGLREADLGSDRFDRALAYFHRIADSGLDNTNNPRVRAAIQALQYAVPRLLQQEGKGGENYSNALLDLGALQFANRQLDAAIATLSRVPPPKDTQTRRLLHYRLARIHGLRASTSSGKGQIRADIEAGVQHFEQAVQAGFTHWQQAKQDAYLDSLREHDTYRKIMTGR